MPYKSEKQRKYIQMKASKGEKWAQKFVKDAKETSKSKSKKK